MIVISYLSFQLKLVGFDIWIISVFVNESLKEPFPFGNMKDIEHTLVTDIFRGWLVSYKD